MEMSCDDLYDNSINAVTIMIIMAILPYSVIGMMSPYPTVVNVYDIIKDYLAKFPKKR